MKNWRLLMPILCAGSSLLILLPGQISPIQALIEQPPIQLSPPQLNQRAKSITVKILSADSLGSGILIHKQNSVYTVLTNAHVIKAGNPPYKIRTPDGKVHNAEVPPAASLPGKDLALVQFTSSDTDYAIAQLGTTPKAETYVVAAGFPFSTEGSQNGGFILKSGQVKWVLDKPLEGGYQIGYTNEIEKGMSGGPILNRAGQLVGVNGMHAHPLWGDPYLFEDGSEPPASQRDQMSEYSWGIPVEALAPLLLSQ